MFGPDWLGSLPSWVRVLLVTLFAEYIAVLILGNFVGLPIWGLFSLQPSWIGGFHVWQPITHLFVPTGPQALAVLFGLVMLMFTLPPLALLLSRTQLIEAFAASLLGGLVGSFLFNAVFTWLGVMGPLPVSGWFGHAYSAVALFGLALPGSTVRLGFVLPVSGQTLAIACGILAGVMFLALPSTMTFYDLAAWAGVMAWWYVRGPGRRRREIPRKDRRPDHFQVLQGGRDGTIH
jgi:hypothetical protein